MGIASLNPGNTLARVHFGLSFTGVTSNEQNLSALMEDFMAFGIVTISSATGATPPNALTAATDANPPLERWLYWATMRMRPVVMGNDHPDVMTWSADVEFDNADTRGQVKANVPAGDVLHLFLTWAPWSSTAWQTAGPVQGQAWASAVILT